MFYSWVEYFRVYKTWSYTLFHVIFQPAKKLFFPFTDEKVEVQKNILPKVKEY